MTVGRRWRNFLKGLYDARPEQRILVTGSARLDLYRYTGDSLQGRYHHLRLHPLSVAELGGGPDFVVLEDRSVVLLVEAKQAEARVVAPAHLFLAGLV